MIGLVHAWPLMNTGMSDRGLDPCDLINVGSEAVTNGIFGYCRHFASSGSNYTYIRCPDMDFSELDTASVSFWFKVSSSEGDWLPFSGQSASYYFMATTGGTGNFYHSNIGSGTVTIYCDGAVCTAPTNDGNWHHYCITGLDLTQWSVLNINRYGGNTASTWNWTGDMCDIRIYDYVLSKKEVKELSKGLIVNYNFEDEYCEPTSNIALVLTDMSNWGTYANLSTGSYSTKCTPLPANATVKLSTFDVTTAGGNSFTSASKLGVSASSTYTISVYIKTNCPFSTNYLYWRKYASDGSQISEQGFASTSNREDLGDGWYRYWAVVTTDANTDKITFSSYFYPSAGTGYYVYYGAPQIDKNDHLTRWTKNLTETSNKLTNNVLCDTVESTLNINTALDITTLLTDPDDVVIKIVKRNDDGPVAIGNHALFLNGAASTNIGASAQIFYGFGGLAFRFLDTLVSNLINTQMTISFWIFIDPASDSECQFSLSARGSATGNNGVDTLFMTKQGWGLNNGASMVSGTIGGGVWMHITFVFNNKTVTRYVHYIDGSDPDITSATVSSFSVVNSVVPFYDTHFCLGYTRADMQDTTKYAKCWYGDFKVYARALTQQDIEDDLKIKSSIDKNGNIFASVFDERNVNNIKVGKNSVIAGKHFAELDSKIAKFAAGYTQLEYIQSDGNQYIDLGMTGSKTTKVEIKAKSFNDTGALFGSRTDAETNNIEIVYSGGVMYLDFGKYSQTRQQYTAPYTALDDFIVYNSYNLRYIRDTEVTTQYTGNDFTTPTNLMLGYAPGSFVSNKWNGRIYYCKLWRDSYTLSRNLVPAKRNRDNAIGMYDIVNRTFYGNAGSGSFTPGPECGNISTVYAGSQFIEK